MLWNLQRLMAKTGRPPTLVELAQAADVSKPAAWKAMKKLQEYGYVTRTRAWRGIRIL
jgi:DNA-binding IclR family transcriptional regulator